MTPGQLTIKYRNTQLQEGAQQVCLLLFFFQAAAPVSIPGIASIAFGSTDNRKTYNNTSSVNLSGNNFYIRDEQDIRSLAVEIATLTRRQQRGRGLRMA